MNYRCLLPIYLFKRNIVAQVWKPMKTEKYVTANVVFIVHWTVAHVDLSVLLFRFVSFDRRFFFYSNVSHWKIKFYDLTQIHLNASIITVCYCFKLSIRPSITTTSRIPKSTIRTYSICVYVPHSHSCQTQTHSQPKCRWCETLWNVPWTEWKWCTGRGKRLRLNLFVSNQKVFFLCNSSHPHGRRIIELKSWRRVENEKPYPIHIHWHAYHTLFRLLRTL